MAEHLDTSTTERTMNITTEPSLDSGRWKNGVVWIGLCVIIGLLAAPIFYGMPARLKLIGLHAWALAALVGGGCAWAAVQQGVRARALISLISVTVALGANLLQSHWGFQELKSVTAQRMPMIPLPVIAGSPDEVAQSLQVHEQLSEALVPTFRDFQRRRLSTPALRRIRPIPLWFIEMAIAVAVAWFTSRQVLQQMTTAGDSDSLPQNHAPPRSPLAD